jgi:hypothetical protein
MPPPAGALSQLKSGRTSASLAAGLAHEAWLQIGEPDVIRPSVCADRGRMTAMIVRAIDQETAHAASAHLGEGDLLRSGGGGGMLYDPAKDKVSEAAANGVLFQLGC